MSEERELYRTTATTQSTWAQVDIIEQVKRASEMLKRAQIPTHLPDAIIIAQKRFDTMFATMPNSNLDVSYFGIPVHVVADDNAVALKLIELNHLNKVALVYDHIPHQIVDLKLLRESMGML